MSDPILTIEMVKAKARKAFAEGLPCKSCPYPWNSAAAQTWMNEYTILECAKTHGAKAAA